MQKLSPRRLEIRIALVRVSSKSRNCRAIAQTTETSLLQNGFMDYTSEEQSTSRESEICIRKLEYRFVLPPETTPLKPPDGGPAVSRQNHSRLKM
jgi:hypothetical protein